MHDIVIALGANLASIHGSPIQTVKHSVGELARLGASIRAESSLYRTPAFPPGSGPEFVNAAVRVTASWGAEETLEHLHSIEAAAGRERITRWGQRTLDLDLIGFDELVLPDAATHQTWRDMSLSDQQRQSPDRLIVPHPRLQDRAFVLVPLVEIAPDWRHPVLDLTAQEMLAQLDPDARAEVQSLD